MSQSGSQQLLSLEPISLISTEISADAVPSATWEKTLDDLLNGDFQQRWQSVKTIAEIGEVAIAPLMELMQDEDLDWDLRWFAARALGQFPRPSVVTALLDVLRTTSDDEMRAIATTTLGQFGTMSIDALTQLMQHPQHRLLAVQSLAGIQHRDAMVPLLRAAIDECPTVRQVAIEALGNFRTEQVAIALQQALHDPSADVRQSALVALGRQVDRLDALNVTECVAPHLWDECLPVCEAAARTLGRLGTEAAIAHLADVLRSPHSPDELKQIVVQALGWKPQPTTVTMLRSIKDQVSQPVQLDMIVVLARMTAPTLKPQAGKALTDWLSQCLSETGANDIKQSLALALAELQVISARSILHRLTTDPDDRVAVYATAALRQLNHEMPSGH